MTIEQFEIGKPVEQKKNPTNVWRLHVRTMHGDADHYETVVTDYSPSNTSSDYAHQGERGLLLSIAIIKALKENKYARNIDDILDEAAKPFGFEYWSDIVCDSIGRDITHDEVWASPQDWYVTWFDEKGIEHKVSIKE
jgi:hypothetical protein